MKVRTCVNSLKKNAGETLACKKLTYTQKSKHNKGLKNVYHETRR